MHSVVCKLYLKKKKKSCKFFSLKVVSSGGLNALWTWEKTALEPTFSSSPSPYLTSFSCFWPGSLPFLPHQLSCSSVCSNILFSYLFLQLSSLLLMRLPVICSSAIPCPSQVLCNITNGQAQMFSFDFWMILRTKQDEGQRPKANLGYTGILELPCYFPCRGDGYRFSCLILSLVGLYLVFEFSFLFRRQVFHLSEHYLENFEKLTETSLHFVLCSSWQVCRKNAYDDVLPLRIPLRISFAPVSLFFLSEAQVTQCLTLKCPGYFCGAQCTTLAV